jgi:hypothetical protein
MLFNFARSHAPLAEDIAKSIDDDIKSARVLAKLAAAVEAKELTKEQIMTFMEGLPSIIQKAAVLPEEILHIAPGWDVVERGGKVIEVKGVSASTYIIGVRGTIVEG